MPPEQTVSVLWDKAEAFAEAALQSPEGWLMTPRRTGTDGFFVVNFDEEVGWAKRSVPTIQSTMPMVGTALRAFAHPHMGLCESRLLSQFGLGLFGGRAARGAMRSAAR